MSARSWLAMGQAAIEAIEVIGKIADIGGDHALPAIRAALKALSAGFAGKMSPQAVLSQIESLQSQLASNDADAMSELDKKFPR